MAVVTFDSGKSSYLPALRGSIGAAAYAPYEPPGLRVLSTDLLNQELRDFGIDAVYAPMPPEPGAPDRNLAAIIDSGIVANHPLLRPRIVASRDFTGEGIEDQSGHGTMRALLTLIRQPLARFVVAKVVGAQPGTRAALIQAMRWAADEGAGVMWMALGEYRPCCRGWCSICRTARRLIRRKVILIASPGNRHGEVACPAKADGVVPTTITPHHRKSPEKHVALMWRLHRIPNYFTPR